MANNLNILDGTSTTKILRTTEDGNGVHTPHHNVDRFPNYVIDGFSRMRVSVPAYRFDSQFTYGADSDLWAQAATNATIAHDATNRMVSLTTTASTNASAVVQSGYYAPYTPGRSQLCFITFLMGDPPATDGFQRVGYFDGSNGVYLEQSSTGIRFVLQSTTDGGTDSVEQADWNYDPMDGTGPSGLTLDLTKSQIFVCQIQALYVGTLGVAFDIDGEYILVHQFRHSNRVADPYLAYASLPVRYEVGGTTSTGSPVVINAICSTVISEGGQEIKDIPGRNFKADRGITTVNVTTRRPILSIRATSTINSLANHAIAAIQSIQVYADANPALIELVRNPTALTGASWTAVDAVTSGIEYDTAATAITGGKTVATAYISAANKVNAIVGADVLGKVFLAYEALNGTPDTFSIVATGFGGASTMLAGINWKEIR